MLNRTREQSQAFHEQGTTFVVHFSNPVLWARLLARPQPGWALVGKGEVVIDDTSVTLRGWRPRPFRTAARHQVCIALSDISNVARRGCYIECWVRVPYMKSRPLRMWLEDRVSTHQLLRLLPTRRASESEQPVTG